MLGLLGAFSGQAAAATITIATFADPTVGAPAHRRRSCLRTIPAQPRVSPEQSFTGGYSSAGANPDLTLNVLGTVYTRPDLRFRR